MYSYGMNTCAAYTCVQLTNVLVKAIGPCLVIRDRSCDSYFAGAIISDTVNVSIVNLNVIGFEKKRSLRTKC